MPLVLAPLGLVVAGLSYGEMKTGFVRNLINKVTKKEESDEAAEEKNGDKKPESNGGATSYRRRSDR